MSENERLLKAYLYRHKKDLEEHSRLVEKAMGDYGFVRWKMKYEGVENPTWHDALLWWCAIKCKSNKKEERND